MAARQVLTSKEATTGHIRLKKNQLCRRYKHYGKMSGVCSEHTNESGNNIDHIIELQIIVKALEHCATEYKRKKWMKDLRSVSNNVNNLQPLSVQENDAKGAAVKKWLAQWPQKSATECFRGADEEKFLNQMEKAWSKLKPEFRRKNLKCLSQTIEKMIHGDTKPAL